MTNGGYCGDDDEMMNYFRDIIDDVMTATFYAHPITARVDGKMCDGICGILSLLNGRTCLLNKVAAETLLDSRLLVRMRILTIAKFGE